MNTTADHPSPIVDIQRRRRGHAFYPPKADRRRTPKPYTTEATPCEAKTIHAKWFVGRWTWYAAEVDWTTGEAFGYVDGGDGGAEWGTFDLLELSELRPPATINGHPFALVVERDCWWKPTKFADVREVAR